MDKVKTYIAIILGVIALGGTVYSALVFFTPISQHEALASRVFKGELQNQIRWIQQQIWALQKHYGCFSFEGCMNVLPDSVKGQYLYLEQELARLREELK